jgi:hypothetical protein
LFKSFQRCLMLGKSYSRKNRLKEHKKPAK